MEEAAIIFIAICVIIIVLYKCLSGGMKRGHYPDPKAEHRYNSLLDLYGVRHVNAIVDQFKTLEEITDAVRRAGLESSNLIFGVDFTASNQYQGMRSFQGKSLHTIRENIDNPYQQLALVLAYGWSLMWEETREPGENPLVRSGDHIPSHILPRPGLEPVPKSTIVVTGIDFTYSNLTQGERSFEGRSLHALGPVTNPYQKVLKIIGETLAPFDEDGIIPAFGFGDVSTKDKSVFPFKVEGYCRGFHEVLQCYETIASRVMLSGPTNFAPLIYQAIDIVKMTRQYHILVIVADGQVTSERATREAIVQASKWPLSIIMVGVGDGPWDIMTEFDDGLPKRNFDNFQFVDYNRVLTYGTLLEPTFALHALMEIPDQFKTIRRLGLLDF